MAPPIPICEPTQFVAGDTVQWQRAIADYPATDGWTLKYSFRGVGTIDVTAQASGTGYVVTIDSATSGRAAAGLYEWVGWVEKAGTPVERHTVASGRVTVAPNLYTASNGSRQQHAERALALIEAQIEQLLASPVESYTVDQTTSMRRKLAELEAARNRYKAELRRLRNRGRPGSYAAHFGRG